MFEDGMKVIKNSEMSDDEIREICDEYSVNRQLVKRIIAGEVFTLEHSSSDSEGDTRVEEHGGDAPWIPLRVLKVHRPLLEGVEEL